MMSKRYIAMLNELNALLEERVTDRRKLESVRFNAINRPTIANGKALMALNNRIERSETKTAKLLKQIKKELGVKD